MVGLFDGLVQKMSSMLGIVEFGGVFSCSKEPIQQFIEKTFFNIPSQNKLKKLK